MFTECFIIVLIMNINYVAQATSCRTNSDHIQRDKMLCHEIPSWQHQPVELGAHLSDLRTKWGSDLPKLRRQDRGLVLTNSEVSRYMDTVIGPFLDTYHRNIQNSYRQLASKLLKRIKEEINAAVLKKQAIYEQLTKLADELNVPEICDEERRMSRTLASKHVADIYKCTEDARASIVKMGTYADNMIRITKDHMDAMIDDASKFVDKQGNLRNNVSVCIKELSRTAVLLGYDLDLSLTNARRHSENSCENLTSCSSRTKKSTDEAVSTLRDLINQCVYA